TCDQSRRLAGSLPAFFLLIHRSVLPRRLPVYAVTAETGFVRGSSRRFNNSIAAHPRKGTNNPNFRLPVWVDVRPTSQGRVAPPRPARLNINPAIRDVISPNLCDNAAIAMGNTADSPSPAKPVAMASAPVLDAARHPPRPSSAVIRPNRESRFSRMR